MAILPGAVLLGMLVLFAASPRANAANVLSNSGFDSWPLQGTGWIVGQGTLEEDTETAVSGSAARATGNVATVSQLVEVSAGTMVSASIWVRGDAGSVSLSIAAIDGDTLQSIVIGSTTTAANDAYTEIRVEAGPVVSDGSLRFEVTLQATQGSITVDSATLTLAAAPPTATPTETSTPTATSTATTGPSPTATSTPVGPTATRTATPTRTARPASAATATRTPTRTATARPSTGGSSNPGSGGSGSPGAPLRTATPLPGTDVPVPSSQPYGGLLYNGNFEQVSADGAAGWQKYGGTVGTSPYGREGSTTVSHLSTTNSTKWLFQVIPVTGGQWYQSDGWAKVESGSAELFIRISWYASSDGSGSALSQVDSNIASSGGWTWLSTGAVQAPGGARSARVRLMLRPIGGASANWDDVQFVLSSAPTATPTPTASPTTAATATSTPRATATPRTARTTSTPRPSSTARVAGPRSSGPGSSGSGSSATSGFLGSQATGTSLVLTEVMPNPDGPGDDNLNEWVEVYNAGTEPVDLQGWQIGDAISADTLGSLAIEPGAYAVIAAGETSISAGVLVVRVPDRRIGNGLNNGGDAVLLIAPDGELADAISYGENADFDAGTTDVPGPGETIGRDLDSGDWSLALQPTPGEANLFPQHEEPVEPGASPSATGSALVATPTIDSGGVVHSGAIEEPVTIVERTAGESRVPWIVLGAAASVGAAGLYSMGSRYAKAALERRRGR